MVKLFMEVRELSPGFTDGQVDYALDMRLRLRHSADVSRDRGEIWGGPLNPDGSRKKMSDYVKS